MRAILLLIRKFSYDIKISHKLFYVIMVMIIVPMICLGILFYQRFENVIKKEVGFSYEQLVSQYTDNINYKLAIYQNLMENITMNQTIQKIFLNQQASTVSDTVEVGGKITSEIESLIYGKNLNEIHSLKLYAFSEDFPNDGRYVSNLSKISDEPWYDKLVNGSDRDQYFIYVTGGLKRQLVAFTKPIVNLSGKSFGEKLGFVKLDIDAVNMFDIKGMIARVNCDSILFFSNDGQTITGSAADGIKPANIWSLYDEKKSNGWNGLVELDGKKKIIACKSVGKYGWVVFFVFPYGEIEDEVKNAAFPTLIVGIALFIVLLGLAVVFSYFFSGRIRRLISKMCRVEEGNLEITEVIQGKDEIGTVDIHFNRMLLRLRSLINENYIQKLERREAELNALQAQINPHFLYNTLEAVNSIAALYGSTEIRTISQNLGDMFRYSINIGRNEFVRLKDELQHIRNYISIQMVRFGNSFDVVYDIPEGLENCRILKFILQPIVENAFLHGFKGNKKGGRLAISAAGCGERLEIYIEDNGKGMDAVQLQGLESNLNKPKDNVITQDKRSIGVINVHSRIQLAYGEDFGLTFRSLENVGTKVTIVLPYVI